MTMPHPCILMLPFGCVICQRVVGAKTSLDIYMDKTIILGLHSAFRDKPDGVHTVAEFILATQDYPNANTSLGYTSVIAYADIGIHAVSANPANDAYQAYGLHSSITKPQLLPYPLNSNVDGRKSVMEKDWFYFLLPDGVLGFDVEVESDVEKHKHKQKKKK